MTKPNWRERRIDAQRRATVDDYVERFPFDCVCPQCGESQNLAPDKDRLARKGQLKCMTCKRRFMPTSRSNDGDDIM